MTWHVQYRDQAGEHILEYLSPEEAVDAACVLLDDGRDVFGIGTGPLTDAIDRTAIARIYDLWTRPRRPFGVR
jgi:hypothetical protein